MKRHYLFLVSGLWFLVSPSAPAIIDTNNNCVSDFWETNYNDGNLFTTFDPQADPDGDGWTNAQEATAGTNPFDANPPAGFICPDIAHTAAVFGDLDNDGIEELLIPEATTINWPTLIGKQYTLLSSPDLTAGSWLTVDVPRIGTGTPMGNGIPLTQPDGSTPDKLFWRVKVDDADSDGDNLTDTEENQFGSDAFSSDTDNDGVNDFEEYALGTSPAVPRIWSFRRMTNHDGTVTYTWNSYAQNGDWFQIEDKQPDGTWKTIYTSTYGSTKLPFEVGSVFYSLTLDPLTDYLP